MDPEAAPAPSPAQPPFPDDYDELLDPIPGSLPRSPEEVLRDLFLDVISLVGLNGYEL